MSPEKKHNLIWFYYIDRRYFRYYVNYVIAISIFLLRYKDKLIRFSEFKTMVFFFLSYYINKIKLQFIFVNTESPNLYSYFNRLLTIFFYTFYI